jgi:hypothetical protein
MLKNTRINCLTQRTPLATLARRFQDFPYLTAAPVMVSNDHPRAENADHLTVVQWWRCVFLLPRLTRSNLQFEQHFCCRRAHARLLLKSLSPSALPVVAAAVVVAGRDRLGRWQPPAHHGWP